MRLVGAASEDVAVNKHDSAAFCLDVVLHVASFGRVTLADGGSYGMPAADAAAVSSSLHMLSLLGQNAVVLMSTRQLPHQQCKEGRPCTPSRQHCAKGKSDLIMLGGPNGLAGCLVPWISLPESLRRWHSCASTPRGRTLIIQAARRQSQWRCP